LTAGIVATLIMTLVMYGLPLVGLPAMDIMAALGAVFPLQVSPYLMGAIAHFANGIVLAVIYALFFHSWLPGPSWLRGAIYSLLPWIFAVTLLGPSLQTARQLFATEAPRAANPCAPVNPCAAPVPANPCAPQPANPCASQAANPCAPVNPCAPRLANPCAPPANPCAAQPANPCGPAPANPCAPQAAAAGGIPPQVLSLIVHLIYGAVVGALYRSKA
jgi:hypothetical protein